MLTPAAAGTDQALSRYSVGLYGTAAVDGAHTAARAQDHRQRLHYSRSHIFTCAAHSWV